MSEEFAGGVVDDADVGAGDEEGDWGVFVGSPMPMWWSLPLWRRVTVPDLSMRSWRTL